MPEDTYTYYAVSPAPAESNGTQATYLIPSVQNGAFNGAWDVMVAEPVEAPALEQNQAGETVQFQFRHKVHVLKIRIPKNNLGEKISEITLAFPQPVTGRMTVDAADPDAAPTLTSGNSTLTLRFDEPKDAGDVVFAVIAPTELTADQPVTITAICETGESEPRDIAGKNFAAGHTTPIAYNVPAIGLLYTRLSFSLPADKGTATLGEEIKKITLTAPAGSLFDNDSNVREFTPDADGKYTMVLKPSWTDNLSGKTVTVQYESESAVVSNTLTVPQITAAENNDVPAFSVPYLLAEDFSNITTFSDNEGTKGVNDPAAIWIPGLSGWSAARVGGSAGKSVRIVGHREGGFFVFADYEARMDSAPFTGLKEGRSVSVRISFDYSGSTNKGAPKLKYGTSTTAGLISGANASIENQAGDVTTNTNGSYDKVNQAVTPFTATCTNTSRIAWVAYGSDGGFSGSYFYYVYLDNVKATIVNE